MSKPDAVLITGATGRIGAVVAKGFAANRWKLALGYRHGEEVAELERQCRDLGAADVLLLPADLETTDGVASICARVSEAGFSPAVLVNGARDRGHLHKRPDGTIARADFEGELRLGVVVPYELSTTLAAAPGSVLRSVINFASIYGMNVPQIRLYDQPADVPPESYGVGKAALLHLTKELAVRLAPRVRVNAISFGGVEGRAASAFTKRYEEATPMQSMLHDEDLFGAVDFLSSAASRSVTGHNLVVDGGWTLW